MLTLLIEDVPGSGLALVDYGALFDCGAGSVKRESKGSSPSFGGNCEMFGLALSMVEAEQEILLMRSNNEIEFRGWRVGYERPISQQVRRFLSR